MSMKPIHTQKRKSQKTFSLKCPVYTEQVQHEIRICLEGVGNVRNPMGNIFTISCDTGLSSISWTESSINCVQVDEASQCDISNHQVESKPADGLNVQKEAQEILPILNDNSLSSSSRYHSSEERNEEATEKEADTGVATQEDGGKLTENYKETTKVAHVSASEDGETLMILEAPPNISIASVPVVPARPKPIGRQYTKEDLQHALELIRQGQLGIKPAARAFNIPVATLHHAARRRKISSPMQQGGNHVLSGRNKIKPAS